MDTGAVVTCIHPKHSIPFGYLPTGWLQRGFVIGVGGRYERFVDRATLTFVGAVAYLYDLGVRVCKPEEVGGGSPSLLG